MKIDFIDHLLAYGPLDAERSPLGGTETSFVALAEALQARGHEVRVHLREPGVRAHQGVEYHRLAEFRSDGVEVAIARSPELLQRLVARSRGRIWWCHRSVDSPSALEAQRHRLHPVVTSRFQAEQLVALGWRGGFDVVPLGCRFAGRPPPPGGREPFTAVWTSSFDRGLRELLAIWRGIRPRLPPGGRIVIAGGAAVYREYGRYLDRVERPLREETRGETDIEWRGPLAPRELHELLSLSGFMPYAATVAESFCLAVLEAQSAGCLPIVTPRGALRERVEHGKNGWIEPPERFGERILAYCDQAGNPADPSLENLRREAKETAARLTWSAVAQQFEAAINTSLSEII